MVIALFIGSYALYSIFYRHKHSYGFLEIIIHISLLLVVANLAFRMLKAVEYYYLYKKDFYIIMALRAINQTIKIFGTFIFTIIAICILFKISGTAILGSLGAMTAVLVLVFRDTILGFVTGIHVATSKNLKVNDWIGIPKYNLEGTILDINLLTTKILNFDKTVSTIPTYDLLTTEIKNLQVMSETNTRRIKKSIYFNINSFKFIDEELFTKLKQINLISDYLDSKSKEISDSKKEMSHFETIVNGAQLTNIGVFRVYAMEYLKHNKNVDKDGTSMVRQLDISPQGLPLEIYCFTNDSKWEHFEQIQADIFDHILVAAKEFDLQVIQYLKN
ncbi:mechanosensitive ion channel family protein [Halpernia sp.]|uniref:mechanosensitive ion channel family protein n=1 Tax=Halpernia sp. TaxID=2782209 RepID=UPI003A91F798